MTPIDPGRFAITVLADLSDPSWRGDVREEQLEERAGVFTGIYLGRSSSQ